MERIINFVEKRLMPVAGKLASNNELNAIRHAMMSMASFFMVGSFFLLLAYVPVKGYGEFLNGIFGKNVFQDTVTSVSGATLGMMGLIVLMAVAYNYAVIKQTDIMYSIVGSLMMFLIVTPAEGGMISKEWLGAKGMFISIVIAMTTTNLYIKTKKLGIAPKMPDNVPPAVMKLFASLFPITVIATVGVVLKAVLQTTSFGNIHNMVFVLLQTPLLKLGSSVFSMMFAESLGQLLWFFGLQGNDIVGSVMSPIWLTQTIANLEAFTAGQPMPYIINGIFKNVFMQIGGSGSTLPLVLMLIMFTKSKQLKALGLLALPASIFNINEPIIFGLPIVLNPVMFLPWMITTPIIALVSYTLMSLGFVAITNGVMIPWTTPVFLSGYLVSGISGAVLQGLILAIAFIIYYPFVKAVDKHMVKKEEKKVELDDDFDLADFEF